MFRAPLSGHRQAESDSGCQVLGQIAMRLFAATPRRVRDDGCAVFGRQHGFKADFCKK
jgi:hypothetical protein